MLNLLEKLVQEYTEIKIDGIKVMLPYYNIADDVNHKGKTLGRFEGKGTSNQLYQEIQSLFEKDPSIRKLSPKLMTQQLKVHGIGVDCSGYVYNLLNEYTFAITGKRFDFSVRRYSGIIGTIESKLLINNRVRKISAKNLTSPLNTTTITSVGEMRVGDLIRLTHKGYSGKHVAIIVNITNDQIIYTHSSDSRNITKAEGPHIAVIKIKSPNKGLGDQIWNEPTNTGQNYGHECFCPDNGDYVCRINCLRFRC